MASHEQTVTHDATTSL